MSILATILAFTTVNRLASSWSGIDWTASFTKFGLAYAPLGIMFTLGSHAIGGLLESGGQTLNVFARGLGIPLSLPAGANPAIVSAWDDFFDIGWLWLAILWSAVIAWQIARTMTDSKKLAVKSFAPHFALMAGSTYVVATVLASH
ncbi:hypothetical protein HYG81_18975 (plasmid) [Natrinema zhouii]|uniref:hypothetical protein n=1 Tax=Natrinema zhouii TaxID=1710539 RepID=UPI001CFFB9DE|nr:hypothetical protein [Natrinema zhouii]UHQ98185.1 hypothetical protein HYG81_18975 [Natrinema zhouii]